MAGLRSTPVTEPPGATRSAAALATTPVPHATSSNRSPGAGSAAWSTGSTHCRKSAGTKRSS